MSRQAMTRITDMGANGEVSRGVTMTERSTAGGPLLDRNVGRRMGWLRRWLTKRELRKQIRYYWKVAEFAWYAGNEESVERHTAYAKNLQKKLDELNYCGKTPNAELNGARRASDLSAELGVLATDWRI